MRTLLERTRDELSRKIHWSKKAVVINVFHTAMIASNPRWNFADSGRSLGFSKAYISEQVKLASVFKDHPDIIHMSRSRALVFMRNND